MAEHNDFGRQGEKLAIAHLQQLGYKLLVVNWRFMRDEIDIVVENIDTIVFVEVKARSTSFFGSPEEFISKSQQKRIINAAHNYIEQNNVIKEARFDVIAIVKNGNRLEVEHIEDAFNAFG